MIGQGQHSSDTAVLESAAKAVIRMRIMSRVWQLLKQNRGFSAKSHQIFCSESRGYAGFLGDTRLLKPAAGFANQFCTTVRGAALAGISFTIKTAFRFSGPLVPAPSVNLDCKLQLLLQVKPRIVLLDSSVSLHRSMHASSFMVSTQLYSLTEGVSSLTDATRDNHCKDIVKYALPDPYYVTVSIKTWH